MRKGDRSSDLWIDLKLPCIICIWSYQGFKLVNHFWFILYSDFDKFIFARFDCIKTFFDFINLDILIQFDCWKIFGCIDVPNGCWRRNMLVKSLLIDRLKMLANDLIYWKITNITKKRQRNDFVTDISNRSPSWSHQHYCRRKQMVFFSSDKRFQGPTFSAIKIWWICKQGTECLWD